MQRSDLKQQLVDAIRMLARADIVDHSGHGSARRDPESFYINSAASVRGALTVDDIVAVNLDGGLVEGSSRPPFEFTFLDIGQCLNIALLKKVFAAEINRLNLRWNIVGQNEQANSNALFPFFAKFVGCVLFWL